MCEPSSTSAASVDPRDQAITLEIAYRMQSAWKPDMASATNTAASLGRDEGHAEVMTWLDELAGCGLLDEALLFEGVVRFGGPKK